MSDLQSPTSAAPAEISELDRLASDYGVELDYQDVWGRRHVVSDATKRAVLEAMGVRCRDGASVRAELDALATSRRQRLLAPAQVIRAGGPLTLTVNLPAATAGEPLDWRVVEEHGAVHRGRGLLMPPEPSPQRPSDQSPADAAEPAGRLTLELRLPTGYHTLEVAAADRRGSSALIVVPERCYLPQALSAGARWWGLGVQLYGVRRAQDWGIGDFSALPGLIRLCARDGAAMVGLSPLHAMFAARPEHASPYAPSSRMFLNVLYIDVERVPDVRASPAARRCMAAQDMVERLNELTAASLVDYPAVAEVKLRVLEAAFHDFLAHPAHPRYQAFRCFCDAEGDELLRHALFETLQEHFRAADPSVAGWRQWPRVYRDPASAAVARFAEAHRERVDFHRWLQWLAEEQLAAAARRAEGADLAVGLYLDLAVSVDGQGAETWANQRLYALDAAVGAPPDVYNPNGQNWGLPPLNPEALKESGYALFVDTLRRNMRHAGAIRIDHVMGLMRLYWIPAGAEPDAGTYVRYPVEDLLGILALESQRNRCLVVGEDLGTVPDELEQHLARLSILSYRLLYFEQTEGGGFAPPETYPERALVAVSTHDLATLAGWWQRRDLEWRSELALFPDAGSEQSARQDRERDRRALLAALEAADLHPGEEASAQALTAPVHRFLARSPAWLQLVQLEDALGQTEQANLPATVDEHPNWRRRMPVAVEDLDADPHCRELLRAVADERRAPGEAVTRLPELGWPRATYRLQLNRDFTFDAARRLVPYLDALGISHVYASPYLQSRAGSPHGYDVVDPDAIDSDIGSRRAHADWLAALRERGMSHILDIVPNHMGVMGDDNAWWLDVLEHGEAAEHSRFFDIDWQPPERALAGKVLLPVLGGSYGEVLERGELELTFDPGDGRFGVRYYEHLFPVDPREYPLVLDYPVDEAELPEGPRRELASIAAALGKLPRRSSTAASAVAERYRDSELLRQRLVQLYRDDPGVARRLHAQVTAINGGSEGDEAGGRATLHELLERQAWRLAHWRTASDEINYRRFFDINDLAGLRVEDPVVFEAGHRRLLGLVARGAVTGLRIDHPDGLYDPAGYFRQLANRCAEERPADVPATYLVAEKILAADERLPDDWSLAGTTGYEFASLVNGLFVNPAGEAPLSRSYARFVGAEPDFHELVYRCKQLVMQRLLAGELRVLTNRLHRLAQADLRTRDFTRNGLSEALREVVACFPVYRTYVRDGAVSDQDRAHVEQAVAQARGRNAAVDASVFDFIRDVLLQQRRGGAEYQRGMLDFTMKLQQFTAPVTAKGIEDTALYRYARLLSLNEVGDEPSRFGVSVETFHAANRERLARWPTSMLSTSSHDSKRGEDVRARLNVLSEIPGEWHVRVNGWRRMNRQHLQSVPGGKAPSRNDEYFLYQTLVGSWPLEELDDAGRQNYRERIAGYMQKAIREAREHTAWTAPDETYEGAVAAFVDAVLDPQRSAEFLADLVDFQRRVAPIGLLNGLAQTLLKLTAPGMPDVYQGSELWNFSLVDPDNRRPVDYARRRRLLERLGPPGGVVAPQELLAELESGLPKLYLIRQLLYLRRRRPALFERGAYLRLETRGALAAHLCAFARQDEEACLVVVVPRLVAGLCGRGAELPLGSRWKDTEVVLPEPLTGAALRLQDVLTGARLHGGERLSVQSLLARFPMAVLATEQSDNEGGLP